MSDRFDFLEIGDARPKGQPVPTPDSSSGAGVVENSDQSTGWKDQRLKAIEIIGDPGTAHGQFNGPTGLAVDRHGAVYICDSNNHRVQRVGMNGELKVYGRPGQGPGEFWGPVSVAVDPSGEFFYVAEQGNSRIQCFQINGQHRGIMSGFAAPTAVTVDVAGRLWVADTGNGRVLCWDGRNRNYLQPLDARARVERPVGIACDAGHTLYVTEGVAEDVVYYRNYAQRVGSLGANRRLFAPAQVAVDGRGWIYLAETGKNRLHVFTRDGDSLATFENLSTRMGSLKSPVGVALGPGGEVYVSDTQNHRVVRLAWE